MLGYFKRYDFGPRPEKCVRGDKPAPRQIDPIHPPLRFNFLGLRGCSLCIYVRRTGLLHVYVRTKYRICNSKLP